MSGLIRRGVKCAVNEILELPMVSIVRLSGKIYPHSGIKRTLFIFRSHLIYRALTREWIHQIERTPWLLALLEQRPSLLERIHRPYQQSHFTTRQRLHSVSAHYAACARIGWQKFCTRVADQPLILANFVGKNDEEFVIFLSMRASAHKEGEWLICFSGACLARCEFSVTLSFRQSPAGVVLFIGGLQGPVGVDAHGRVKEVTRALYGERPRNLMLEVVRTIARVAGCVGIELVSSATHVYQHARRRKNLHFDYDQFARDEAGVMTPDQTWLLPMSHPQKALSEIPSKKRSEYTKKYSLIHSIQSDITTRVMNAVQGVDALEAIDARLF